MLRHFAAAHERARRRPRARGDAPTDPTAYILHTESPPRPRGCSSEYDALRYENDVAPAPAGMLPARIGFPCAQISRPRARGDAPMAPDLDPRSAASPPRPRGCSSGDAERRRGRGVAPAPAGMLPRCSPAAGPHSSRPRARGDAPLPQTASESTYASPPRPRGCSQDRDDGLRVRTVAPAPAGMLPAAVRRAGQGVRRPRARGDAPLGGTATMARVESPPRPRGCSPRADAGLQVVAVAPAPAGMLPPRTRSPPNTSRRPRARGDAPRTAPSTESYSGSPPRPRGCSPGHALPSAARPVAPAPARGVASTEVV